MAECSCTVLDRDRPSETDPSPINNNILTDHILFLRAPCRFTVDRRHMSCNDTLYFTGRARELLELLG